MNEQSIYQRPIRWVAIFLALACAMSGVVRGAIVDSIIVSPRVFNDFSTSTLTITNNYPSQAIIDDRSLVDDGMGGSFANRHDLVFSSDGGSTPNVFNINEVFTQETRIRLDAGSLAPRKEAGIRINSSATGDALFIINSDAGEIVAFGGGAPFYRFGDNGTGNGYTPGTTILMGLTYRGDTTPRTVQYFIDRDPSTPEGIESSAAIEWANNKNGPVDFRVGLYAQVGPADADDFITATFSNIIIPEPASGILLATTITGLGLLSRPRNRAA